MRRIGASMLLLLGGLAPALPAAAEEPERGGVVLSRDEPTLHGELRLALGDAVAMAIENNLDVEIARHAPLIALEEHEIAWGAYDPLAQAEFGFASIEQPTSSVFQGDNIVDETYDGSTAITGLVPYLGASYSIGYDGRKVITDSSVTTFSPEYRVGLEARLAVPLMRDLVWNEPWTQVTATRILYDAEREGFRRELMDSVRATEGAYWALVAAEEQLGVEEKSLETARALLDQTRIQYEVGVISRVEVTEAEAGVAEREVNLIRAENVYRSAQDRLIDLVLGPYLTPLSRLEIEPTDDPEEVIVFDVDVEEASRKAFDNRPELASARQEVQRRRVLLKFARNQLLPRLDAEGFYGMAGLSGDTSENPSFFDRIAAFLQASGVPVDPPPPGPPVNQSFSDAHDTFFKVDKARQWGARGIFSIPIGNNSARHRATQFALELRRSVTQVRRLEQSIVLEVRQAARDLESAQEGIRAAERRREAAAEQLRAERIRLENGESTPFDVLERERDFVESESQKIAALQLYHTSVAALHRAEGTTLRSRNIRVDEAARLR